MDQGLPVLVVEHDESLRHLACELLTRDLGWGVVAPACDAIHALALLDAGFVPTLVLLDLEVPSVRRQSVLRRLRSDPRYSLTAVVVTSGGEERSEPRERWLPGEVWLSRPFQLEDLTVAIDVALSRLVESSHASRSVMAP
jgi:CheY-like chemotaxis protein